MKNYKNTKKSIELVHIITSLDVGGAEQMLKRLLFSDPTMKNRALILSLSGVGSIGQQLQNNGYQVYGLDFHQPYKLLGQFLNLVKILKTHRHALVQTWMYHSDFFGGIAARLAGCKQIVWGIRSSQVPANNKKTYCIMRLSAKLSRFVPTKIICVAEAARKYHHAHGYHLNKMTVISNGFDFSIFDLRDFDRDKLRKSIGINPTDLVIGCVGRYHVDKGQDLLVEAANILKGSSKQPLKFLFVGKGCDAKNELFNQQIKKAGLSNQVILYAERHDIPQCLAMMDIYCMPSRSEGFPNGLGEAMAMGLPCVAANVGDTQVLTGEHALLYQAGDPKHLAAKLLELIEQSPQQRKLLGQQASQKVRSEFTIDICRERFYDLYRKIRS